MIRCIHKIDMVAFPSFGDNSHYVVKWELQSLGYSPTKCDIEWYDELGVRTYLWTKPRTDTNSNTKLKIHPTQVKYKEVKG